MKGTSNQKHTRGGKPSLKDYVLVKRRLHSTVLDTRVYRGGDMNSDHRLVATSIHLKLKVKRRDKKKHRFDIQLLQHQKNRSESEERLARWRQHFEKVLNVQGTVEENVIGSLEQPSDNEVPEITREEVEQAMKRLKNGRAAGEDEIVAELLKNGGDAMID